MPPTRSKFHLTTGTLPPPAFRSRFRPQAPYVNAGHCRVPFLADFSHALFVFDLSYLNPFIANWPGIAGLLGSFLLLRLLGSPTCHRWRGESFAVRAALRKLDSTLYHVYHDLQLPRPDRQGFMTIDHAVVSQFGIFVIERMHFRGLIIGSAKQCLWTQQNRRRNRRFDNPLHQNDHHVRALTGYLGLPEDIFHPIIHFACAAEFKSPMPENVLNRDLLPWILRHNSPILDPKDLYRATSRFDNLTRSSQQKSATPATTVPLKASRAG